MGPTARQGCGTLQTLQSGAVEEWKAAFSLVIQLTLLLLLLPRRPAAWPNQRPTCSSPVPLSFTHNLTTSQLPPSPSALQPRAPASALHQQTLLSDEISKYRLKLRTELYHSIVLPPQCRASTSPTTTATRRCTREASPFPKPPAQEQRLWDAYLTEV